ncbi:hypothetical protein GUITHDRAFT_102530 [Guillardia theta CCMP2712]|uniref:Uncharacterized protein n=1 Tax=Guillardia theta (strain CCMP2712) TaxID=905079 RepID=L1JU24_GUITC|nr:hypothetical protein GUITHDRAFT_102530 [Guillardia theta CCMP2712]EKX51917.1 hypothetical protein GUITHDRAFT_102530 [Guillardia theta CCMP2712]|eukprot:XP_005838897.1 hypothetical protein GUITHDRAFT_102530 [Guillardia theta CCMP2712]
MEIEFHFQAILLPPSQSIAVDGFRQVHNISVFFASPSLIVQGSFLNPGELGFTPSSLLGERSGETVAPVADGVCDTFSFFDCHAEKEWDECVALRERCRGEN